MATIILLSVSLSAVPKGMSSRKIYSGLAAATEQNALNNCLQIFENQIAAEIRGVLRSSGRLLNVGINVI